MKRLTEPTIGCFKFDIKDHKHEVGEFNTYEAFYNYNVAVMRLGEYEETGLMPDEITAMKAENEQLHKDKNREIDSWNNTDCNTCPISNLEACDEICSSKADLIKYIAQLRAKLDVREA